MPKQQPGLTQVSVKAVDPATLEKLQTIADIEGVTYTELYNKAFTTFIELYEKKHGKIKAKPKGKGLDLLS